MLGDPLLVRVGPRMQLTARGEALRYPVKDVLSRVRDLLVMEKFDATRSTRTFHLFVSDYAGDLLLPLVRKQLQREAPGISIRVQNDGRTKGDSFELAHSVDLAIACVPSSFKGFYQQRLFTDRDACAARRGNHFLVGDAAAVLDPSSSHGILRALASGILTANCILKVLSNDKGSGEAAVAGYAAWQRSWFLRDANRLQAFRYTSADSGFFLAAEDNTGHGYRS